MALTREILAANAVLTGLSDEQVNAIVTLSENDENSVIAKKTGEIYGNLDADILAVSGVEKNGAEKTYDYAKRVLGDFKTKADSISGLKGQIDTLKAEKQKLEKAIADGSADAETKKALKQAKADLESVTSQYTELNNKYNAEREKHEKELFSMRIDNELQGASAGLTFKSGLPESVVRIVKQQAFDKVKAMNPEYVENDKGEKMLVFKDETGAIMRNQNNQLNPYTASELFVRELETMDVLDKGRKQQGGGTGFNGGQGGGNGIVIDLSGCKTRVEATDAIKQALMTQGLTVGSEEYEKAMNQAWTDYNVMSMPEK